MNSILNNLKSKLFSQEVIFPLLLVVIAIFICIANYVPGTYLSGWDTLHPEFDFTEYFHRSLSVWQEHQGLGAVASQAHASELPRIIILYILSLFFPNSFLRYLYIFLTLIIGPLGVLVFIREIIGKHYISRLSRNCVSFISGLYYLLNLVTLQQFALPLEMFTTHYASVAWIFLFSTKYLFTNKIKYLIFFITTIILSSSIAHTPTLFYVFFLLFGLYLLSFKITAQTSFKKIFLILLITITLNLYWILPNVYYVSSYGQAVANSKINTQFSDQAIQVERNFGNLKDSALLRNFLFNWGEYDEKRKVFVYIFENWRTHIENPQVILIGLLFFTITIIGLTLSIVYKNPIGISFLPVFLVSFFFIASDNPIFQLFSNFLLTKIKILNEALRFTFTKFSIILIFSYSVYFAIAFSWIIKLFTHNLNNFFFSTKSRAETIYRTQNILSVCLTLVLSIGLVYYMFPFFTGNLINSKMRVKIPNQYFELFDFFRKQSKYERIGLLPVNTYTAWSYYNWHYEGAGFLWFGLRQPLLNREFDRWMPFNENFYWEASFAINSKNLSLLEEVLNKYQVNWLVLDQSIIDPSSSVELLNSNFDSLINNSSKIFLSNQFGNIRVYHVINNTSSKNFVSLLPSLPTISPEYKWTNYDKAYLDNGNYISLKDNQTAKYYYPFRSLFSDHLDNKLNTFITQTQDSIIFSKKVDDSGTNYKLKNLSVEDQILPWQNPDELNQSGLIIPKVSFDSSIISVTVPKVKNYYSVNITPADKIASEAKNCDYLRLSEQGKKLGEVTNEVVEDAGSKILRLKAILADNCSAQFYFPTLSGKLSYLISIKSRNVQNKNLLFRLENIDERKNNIETYLPKSNDLTTTYFIQPPLNNTGSGYSLHFENSSYNLSESINDLGEISIYPIPFDFLSNITLESSENVTQEISDTITSVNHPSSGLYQINLNKNGANKQTLSLFQSFDPGWHAYFVNGLSLNPAGKHQLLNNWANGWEITPSNSKTILIIFLPQLLEIFGLSLFCATLFLIIFQSLHQNQRKLKP